MLFILLTGRPPVYEAKAGDEWFDLLANRPNKYWARLMKAHPSLTTGARNLLIKAFTIDPEARPSIGELLTSDPWLNDASPTASHREVKAEIQTRKGMVMSSGC